jgi:hypothetical protein
VTGSRQLLRGGQSRRTRTDDRHGLTRFTDRHGRFDKAFIEAAVDDVPFEHPDRHGIAVDS